MKPIKSGEKLGPYRVVRKIGQGGMGEVFEAFEDELRRHVAIKVLSQENPNKPMWDQRFKAEGRALARLSHPNIVAIHTMGEHEGRTYLAMEYVDGLPLDKFLLQHPCGIADVLHLLKPMLEGLACAHAAGIIHRDIKPQNIVVDRARNVKLLDFGISKISDELNTHHTATGALVGTLNYIAPEVVRGADANPQSDIYSLGLVAYYMLTGQQPFSGKSNFEILERIRTQELSFSNSEQKVLPKDLREFIWKMTARETSLRFRNSEEALQALLSVKTDSLPVELIGSVFTPVPLTNGREILSECVIRGMAPVEARMVLNLAARLHVRDNPQLSDPEIKTYAIPGKVLDKAVNSYVKFRTRRELSESGSRLQLRLAIGALVLALCVLAAQFKNGRVASAPVSAPASAPEPERETAAITPAAPDKKEIRKKRRERILKFLRRHNSR